MLHLGTFVGSESAFTSNIFKNLCHVNKTSCFIKQCTRSIELSLDVGNHFSHSREFDDSLAKLLAVVGISHSFAISSFADTNRLRCNAQTSAVHKSHHIFDKTQFARANKFSLSVLEHQFACRTTLDAKLVLDAANNNATIVAVVDEHRKTATVFSALFRASKYKRNVCVAVCDETLDAVQAPSAIGFVICSLEHNSLQVATGIWLSEVHCHCFACANAGEEALLLVLIGKFVDSFSAVLQTPNILESCIGTAHNVVCHNVRNNREVQAVIATWQRNAHHAGLVDCIEVLLCAFGIFNMTVNHVRTFGIYRFGIWGNHLCSQFASNLKHLTIRVHRIFKVDWCIVIFFAINKVAFLERNDSFHQRMVEVILKRFIVGIKISHFCLMFIYLEFFL